MYSVMETKKATKNLFSVCYAYEATIQLQKGEAVKIGLVYMLCDKAHILKLAGRENTPIRRLSWYKRQRGVQCVK